MAHNIKEFIGRQFHRWTVTSEANVALTSGGNIRKMCIANCQCGSLSTVDFHDLLRGKTKSCGCLRAELSAERIQIFNNKRKTTK